jgi:hypothetical protein
MDDAVARYRVATERNDIAALMQTLAPDPALISPISGRMVFRGRRDVEILATAVYGALRELHWSEQVGADSTQVLIGEGRVGPVKLGDAMVFELDDAGRIRTIRPHLRPWLALTMLALKLGPRLARHPGILWRALRPPRG